MAKVVDAAFTKDLPKVELHAHLTGSITPHCLHQIWTQRRLEDPNMSLQDPLEAMSRDKSWDIMTFFPLFSKYIYELCSTPASIIYSTNAVLHDFKDDGVVYLELRTTPRSSSSMSKDDYITTTLSCIDRFPDRNVMATYLILSVDRRNSPEEAIEVVDLAIRYRSRGVVGVDLCGDPSKGDVSTFKEAFHKAKLYGLKISLHFAEIPASSSLLELSTLLSFQPDRLGHVIHVPNEIKDQVKDRKLGLELCVSCNVKAKLIEGGVIDHHFVSWVKTGCPVILCTDDVGVFDSTLSNEYLLIAQAFNLSRNDLIDLCDRAVEAIFGDKHQKQRLWALINDARVKWMHTD
ncbi:hypothetical protein HO173_005545 [Letharia columbiana]|uniref:Adenosine deaminase domain-containing protein n=1 Tax=Letharia columbiana TaxID=112416 RepID=A0A8H6FWW7_9LECA|nr:uncharacterized protein HO173_005545 [Letharia columbiana]KAF6236292.1 hypothetical protein HO173_005545 [Letharia columbiana]